MHEYAVTKSIVDIAVNEAQKAGAEKITSIRLVIGELSSIVDESVGMYFEIIAADTLASGAVLSFKRIPAQFRCNSCGLVYDKAGSSFFCPECGASGTPTGVGKEFYIESIEVE